MDEKTRLAKNARIKASMQETRQRRKTQACKAFTLKITANKLNKRQKEELHRLFLEAKWLRNAIVASSSISDYDELQKTVEILNKDRKKEVRELNTIGSQMKQGIKQQVKNDLKSLVARKGKGHRVGRLKFVSTVKSVDLKQYGGTYKFYGKNRVRVQNISGRLYVRGLGQLDGWEIANAKLLNKPDGYYLTVTAYRGKEEVSDVFEEGTIIGIDMGVKTHMTMSDGRKCNALVKETERLKRLQRKLARQKKGSNNYRKTLDKINIEYQKMNNRKDDLANKLVHDLLLNEIVFMQDENLKGWKSGKRFGSRLQHSILGRVKAKLIKHDRVVVLRKNAPTTKTCVCGKKNELSLSDRVYVCSCGYENDRDVHAAQNMIRLGSKTIPVERRDFKLVERMLDLGSSGFERFSVKQEASKSLA